MQENYTYKQKIRHAENVARSYQDKCSEMSLNCHISVSYTHLICKALSSAAIVEGPATVI